MKSSWLGWKPLDSWVRAKYDWRRKIPDGIHVRWDHVGGVIMPLGSGQSKMIPLIVAILYLVAATVLLPLFLHWINPDGTSYLSIAGKYLRGDVSHAVNGYWSPLLSWLLIPFLALGVPPVPAAKVLSLCIGVFGIASFYFLSRRFDISDSMRFMSLLFLLPLLLFFTLFDFTPDLLLASFLALYLYVLLAPDYPRGAQQGRACGLFAALAYLSKAYALPFCIVHFAICNAVIYIKGDPQGRRVVLRSAVAGYVTLFVISGLWIACLSAKYNRFEFGAAGRYNHERMGFGERRQPPVAQRFLVPPNDTATHAWEDPTYIRLQSWSPLESMQAFKYQIGMVRATIESSIAAYNWFSLFSIAILAAALLGVLAQAGESAGARRRDLFAILAVGVYTAGFLPLGIVQERYLLVCAFLLVVLGAQLIGRTTRGGHLGVRREAAIMAVFLLSFCVMPVQALKRHAHQGDAAYVVSLRLADEGGIKGDIASNGNFKDMLQVAFRTGNRYFGVLEDAIPERELMDSLRAYNISYFFVWGPADGGRRLPGCPESTLNGVQDLRIYAVRAADPGNP